MKRLQIISFLSLIYLINSYCPQYFAAVLKTQCESLVINATHSCTYLNGVCTTKKSQCESYTGTSEDECGSIKPKEILNKCAMVGSECKEVPKVCEDYISGIDTCSKLQTDDNTKKRCVLSGGKCLAHYRSCIDFVEGVSETLCNMNIPEDTTNSKKCKWDSDNNRCIVTDKQCKDYEYMAHDNCPELGTSDSDKVCFSSPFGFGCVEQYKTCELYDEKVQDIDKSKTKCESIRYFSDTGFDYTKACYFSDNHCKTKDRECSDNISQEECTLYSSKLLPLINPDKICVFSEYQCKDQYKTCELYNEKVEASKRNEKACKAIIYYDTEKNDFDHSYKCIFENKECKKMKKDCIEITDKDICINHVLDDENKMCVFENGQCKEEYKSCSDYNKVANKNEKNCRAIKIYLEDKNNIDYTKRCIYEHDECKEKELTQCSDYESDLDKKYCTNINLDSYKKCIIKDNKCTQIYITCPGNNEVNTQEECESILPLDESKKCILDESNNCIQKEKECSEYTGTDSYDCQQCISSETDKKCFIENGKCVAKYTECEKYGGNDAEICKKIIPYDSTSGNYLGNINKCIMDGTNCKMTLKECNEANNYQECASLSAEKLTESSGIKICIFKDGKCKEQYKDCDTYNDNNSGQIDRGICESIVMVDGKCSYTVSGTSISCEKVDKQCSDFQVEDYASVCIPQPTIEGVTFPINIKCLYANSQCADINKSCLELSSISLPAGTSDADAYKICAVASTSYPNRKQCVLKNDKSGCEEIDKEITDDDDDNGDKNNAKENKGNFCLNKKQFIINFIFIIFGILL